MLALLPPDLAPGAAALLVAVSALGSFLTGALGLGGGLLTLSVMAGLLPAAALIPVHGLVQLGSNIGRAGMLARHVDRGALPVFALGTLAGCTLGGLLVTDLPGQVLRAAVALFILWTLALPPPAWMARSLGLTGAASSLLTMFVGATGPFVAAVLRATGLPKAGLVATHAACMTLQHGVKVAVFALLGFGFGPWLPLVAAMIGAGLLGTWAGRAVLLRLDAALFDRAFRLLLALLALRLLWGALTSH